MHRPAAIPYSHGAPSRTTWLVSGSTGSPRGDLLTHRALPQPACSFVVANGLAVTFCPICSKVYFGPTWGC